MSPKSAVIAAAAVAVLAFAVYLFIQVRSTPAQANATHVTPAVAPHAEAPPPPTVPTPPTDHGVTPKTAKDVTAMWKPQPQPELGREVDGPPSLAKPDPEGAQLKLDNLMELANKAYDSQDFDQATAIAGKVLSKDPNNIRMLRIMVSSNCISGDNSVAQQYYDKLPATDKEQMRARCDRYGVTFKQ